MSLTFAVALLFGMPPMSASLQQWVANLAIASPALGQPYMDGAYWSIVTEITFYAWLAVFIAIGLFPRHLVTLMAVWLAVSLLNMTAFHSGAVEKILLTDVSGFFAAGVLLYEIHFRQSTWLNWTLLAAAGFIAADRTIDASAWSRAHYDMEYSNSVNAALSIGSIALVGFAALIRRLPFNAALVAALGGLTYPLYLLHQHVGYIIFNWSEGFVPNWLLVTAVIALMLVLSWAIWRFEPEGQRLAKRVLSSGATRLANWRRRTPLLGASPSQALAGQDDLHVRSAG
jgi:peptidoglycan/LPS O-acetylase OafA/YrhL